MEEALDIRLLHFGTVVITVRHLLWALSIILIARLASFLLSSALHRFAQRRKVDPGREYAVRTLIQYLLYTLAIVLAVQTLGFNLSVIWAGAAALFVGLGFGLQHFFNDLVSGLILLMEGTVEVNDVVLVDDIAGRVVKIGLRTTHVETIERKVIIIPNHRLVAENVINWSHRDTCTRFSLQIGVGYQSDPRLVERLLLQAATAHPEVEEAPAPNVRFSDFGDSELQFTLHFFTRNILGNEVVKSDLRFEIIRLLRQHQIEMPFPQRDLWIRNAGDVPPQAKNG